MYFWGSKDGAVVRVLATHFCALGFDSRTWRHMRVEYVFGSRPCFKGFSPGPSVLLPPQKSTFQISIQTQWKRRTLRAT